MRNDGFLILEISGDVFSIPAPLGDRTVQRQSAELAARHGFELKPDGFRRSFEEKRAWPLTARSYTSPRRDGRGRSGSAIYSFPAKAIPSWTCCMRAGDGKATRVGRIVVCECGRRWRCNDARLGTWEPAPERKTKAAKGPSNPSTNREQICRP